MKGNERSEIWGVYILVRYLDRPANEKVRKKWTMIPKRLPFHILVLHFDPCDSVVLSITIFQTPILSITYLKESLVTA